MVIVVMMVTRVRIRTEVVVERKVETVVSWMRMMRVRRVRRGV